MKHSSDIILTALAPAIWGSTYLVTTEMLPAGYPLTLAVLRALPAGLLLLVLTLALVLLLLLYQLLLLQLCLQLCLQLFHQLLLYLCLQQLLNLHNKN